VVSKIDGKGGKGGVTYPPKNQNDPIVVVIDSKDVGDSLLYLILILYHELIHVNQLRNEAYSKEILPNWEVEAHAKTLPLLVSLYKQFPTKGPELEELLKKVIKNLKKYLPQCKDKLRALKDLVSAKKDIKSDLNNEVASLSVLIGKVKAEIKNIKWKLIDLEEKGLIIDGVLSDLLDSIKEELEALEKMLDELLKKLKDLIEKNKKLLDDLDDLIGKMEKVKENEEKIKELQEALKDPPSDVNVKDWRNEKKGEVKALQKENIDLRKKIQKLRGSIHNQIKDELKAIKDIVKLKEDKGGIYDEIDRLQNKFAKLLALVIFFQLYLFPEYEELMIELLMIGVWLGQIKIELKIIDFKLKILKHIETFVKQGMERNYW
jgi:DNA repair exonuclease SbcCD ATPase subunit